MDAGIEVLWVARYDYQPNWKLKTHEHEFHQLIYVMAGSGRFFLDGNEYRIRGDVAFFIKPGQLHGLVTDQKTITKTMDIKYRVRDPDWMTRLCGIRPYLEIPHSVPLRTSLESIRQEGLNKEPYYKDVCCLHLMQVLLFLLRLEANAKATADEAIQDPDDSATGPVYRAVARYVHENYSREVSLRRIASAVGYNQSYICQVLQKEAHCTPMKFLYRYRIERAKELISYSDWALKQIAEMVGFKSVHHFTRWFRNSENTSPGQWREREKAGIRKDVYISENFVNLIFTESLSPGES